MGCGQSKSSEEAVAETATSSGVAANNAVGSPNEKTPVIVEADDELEESV
eukprot:CAMPEP_0198284516 /NCGR_PEP_ID=MMETSP1449-20131203/3972_1 /TAXON_ID=420275 /ORGANISM="Attheya septentrionalis, Strain CCMP2084" /LENGTH=49 /DNA_ID=CAMNT_0043981609 /DNA_START=40 /DNA_END=189 /DNA_ORIENTATION=-